MAIVGYARRGRAPAASARRGGVKVIVAGGVVIAFVAGVAALVSAGVLVRTLAAVEGLPPVALTGSALLLLAVAGVGGTLEARHVWLAHLAHAHQRRIARLTPLARLLGLPPLALGHATVATLYALSPQDFERAMGELLTLQGYRRVHCTGGSGDLAADLMCLDSKGQRVVAQCKRYAPDNHVGSQAIQLFFGMTFHHQARFGLFLTTSAYTKPALDLAHAHTDRLRLVDGAQLVAMVRALAVA